MTPKLSYELMNHWARASERRVLLIVGVRYTFSNFLIFASSRLHMPSSHIHIFTFSHLHIFTSSHIIFAYLRLFTSSDLHIYTYHLHIFTSYPHISSSHLHIYTYHLHVFTSSHLHILPSRLHIFSLSLSPSFSFLSWGRGRCWRGATKWLPFRTKWWSIVKNWSNIAILGVPAFVCKRVVCKCVCVCNNVSVCVCACKSGCA